MEIFNHYTDLPDHVTGGVVVIGNFDGVHRGHQALLARAQAVADEMGRSAGRDVPVGVLTFEPHPRRLFQPDLPPERLTPMTLKAARLSGHNIQALFSLPFTWDFASQSAEHFIQNILIDGLKAAHIVVGYDFRFGQLRKGTAEMISAAGLPVTVVEPVADKGGQAISSSRIRVALRAGDIAQANNLLGWEWEIQGSIFRGDRRGHELGYPTANLLLKDTLHPAYGIYACRIQIEGEDEWRLAATNIGIRPMFEVREGQVEAHILDFPDRDIYGRILRVRLVERLRGEAKFDSLDDLITQMDKDCARTREILA